MLTIEVRTTQQAVIGPNYTYSGNRTVTVFDVRDEHGNYLAVGISPEEVYERFGTGPTTAPQSGGMMGPVVKR